MSTTITKREQRGIRAWEPLQSLREEVENLWPQLFGDRVAGRFPLLSAPPVDVCETADTVKVQMDLPGFKTDEINVQLNNGVLTVSGERRGETKEEGEKYHRLERRTGGARSVTLPAPVAEKGVDAKYHDGVLTLVMPKTPEAKSCRIKVKG